MNAAAPLSCFGVVGDIHAEDTALAAALEALRARGVERVLAVGDVVDGRGDVARCVSLLRDAGALVVRGNHERWYLTGQLRDLADATPAGSLDAETEAWLAALPGTRTIATIGGPLLLCHGLGEHDMAGVRPDDDGYALSSNDALHALVREGAHALMVNGHTHRRMVRRFGALTVMNAGTLHPEHGPGFVRVDLAARSAQFFDVRPDGAVREAEWFVL